MVDCESSNLNLSLQELFNEFINDAAARNLSKRTIGYYQYCYKWLTKTLPCEKQINLVTKQDINKHILFLLETNRDTSVNSHLTGLRTIFNYANNNYGTSIKIKLIKVDKLPKPTYTNEELNRLLEKPDLDKCNFSEYRDWVMTNVFIATGCRLGSCINLKVKDIDITSSTIYFRKMKNRKALLLPLNAVLKNILIEYINHTRFRANDYLFPSSSTCDKFTDVGFCASYREYAEKRNVQKAGIHKFRHTYAKLFIMKGGNPAKLQRILGHSSIEITMNYVNLYSIDLKDDINTFCFLNMVAD